MPYYSSLISSMSLFTAVWSSTEFISFSDTLLRIGGMEIGQ